MLVFGQYHIADFKNLFNTIRINLKRNQERSLIIFKNLGCLRGGVSTLRKDLGRWLIDLNRKRNFKLCF